MKKLVLVFCLIYTSAFAQQQVTDPKLLESMYKECSIQRNNTNMLSDYHAAVVANLKNKVLELETNIKELEKDKK
jgi:hypothetical protein